MNLRPSGYEPDELPDCSTPRHQKTEDRIQGSDVVLARGVCAFPPWLGAWSGEEGSPAHGPYSVFCLLISVLPRPGGDLLSHALRRSTIGAEGFHGRVRDGIGCGPLAMTTRPAKAGARGIGSWLLGFLLPALNAFSSVFRERDSLLSSVLRQRPCRCARAVVVALLLRRRVGVSIKPIERLVPVG